MERKTLFSLLLLLAAGTALIVSWFWISHSQDAPRREAYRSLARCLQENDAVFYGAFWCPHCGEQKALFSRAQKHLPYVECSMPDEGGQAEECKDAGVTNYPDWRFASGIRCTGVLSAEVLAHLSGCDLPSYEGKEYTAEGLFAELVTSIFSRDSGQADDAADEREAALARIRDEVVAYLQSQHGVTFETASADQMLSAIAMTVHACASLPDSVGV